jgi:tRNA-(ms[2]io[6]A)-hydroxylase
MLGLQLPTDPRWVKLAESNLEALLTDHAFCEQKAASNAISLVVTYPDKTELVKTLLPIAREELEHFEQVHKIILHLGFSLGFEQKDAYVNELLSFVRKGQGREIALLDRLLFAAMIEARSCERFKMLSEKIENELLRTFYRNLMESEAGHYTTFIKLAKEYCPKDEVQERWNAFLAFEASIMERYSRQETMHG